MEKRFVEERFRNEVEPTILMANQLDEIRGKIETLEESSASFRKKMTIDFVDTISKRFEKVENAIKELGKMVENYKTENLKIRGLISKANSRIIQVERKRIEEKEMEDALKRLAGSEKIKVNRKLLEELKK